MGGGVKGGPRRPPAPGTCPRPRARATHLAGIDDRLELCCREGPFRVLLPAAAAMATRAVEEGCGEGRLVGGVGWLDRGHRCGLYDCLGVTAAVVDLSTRAREGGVKGRGCEGEAL